MDDEPSEEFYYSMSRDVVNTKTARWWSDPLVISLLVLLPLLTCILFRQTARP